MTSHAYTTQDLINLKPEHDFFVGIDSDGCAFDTMEIKHKECFCPNIINYWGLQPVSKYAREAAEFVNLYSKWRGINRWPALMMIFDLLRERPEVVKRQVSIPQAQVIRDFIASGLPQSDNGLRTFIAQRSSGEQQPELQQAFADLEQALAWTTAVNKTIADMVHGVPPFPYVRESLEKLGQHADIIVVSATPTEALIREWEEHDIARYARVIAGQELGKKEQHLAMAAKGKYQPDHILMIGDAPGDFKAARAVSARFYPINPGHEDDSWQRFFQKDLGLFLSGGYTAGYEAKLIIEFEKLLPDTPPWKR